MKQNHPIRMWFAHFLKDFRFQFGFFSHSYSFHLMRSKVYRGLISFNFPSFFGLWTFSWFFFAHLNTLSRRSVIKINSPKFSDILFLLIRHMIYSNVLLSLIHIQKLEHNFGVHGSQLFQMNLRYSLLDIRWCVTLQFTVDTFGTLNLPKSELKCLWKRRGQCNRLTT